MARTQAALFTDMADTFAAISRDPAALQQTIEKTPADAGRGDQLVPRPAPVPGRLHRPLAPAAPRGAGAAALAARDQQRAGASARRCCRAPSGLNETLEGALGEAEDLFDNPNTLLALRDLGTALRGEPPGARVHRALPDGLQLLHLLPASAGRGAVGGAAGPHRRRHGAQPERQDREHPAAEQLRHPARARGPGTSSRARSRRAPRTRWARRWPASTSRPTSRRSTRRATPTARTARTAIRTARWRSARAASTATSPATSRTAPTPRACPRRAGSARAPTARSRPTTCRGSRAAPTSRASSASTTWRTCHEPLPRRRAGAGPDRDLRLLRVHARPTRSRTRTSSTPSSRT